jgi:hypothetical protein
VRKPNAERTLFGSHDENYVVVVEPDCSALAGRQDGVGTIQVGKRADLVLIALDEVTTGLCGPDGAAVVYYGLPQPSTRCSSTAG